jgi:hypothetical protein
MRNPNAGLIFEVKEAGKPLAVVLTVAAAAMLGVAVTHFDPRFIVFALAALAFCILLFVSLARFGVRGAASLMIYSGFCTLGMTAVRVSSSVAVSDVFFLGAAGLLLGGILISGASSHIDDSLRPLFTGGILLISGSLVASVFAENVSGSLSAWFRLVVAVILLPLLLAVWSPNVKEIKALSASFVVSATLSGLAGLIIGPPDQYQTRAWGLATHPNSLALISVLAIGVSITGTLAFTGVLRVAFGLASLILAWVILDASGSRAGVLGLAAVLFTLFVLTRSKVLFCGFLLGATVFVFLLQSGSLDLLGLESLGRLIGGEESRQGAAARMSDVGRVNLMKQAWADFLDKPLIGVGVEHARTAHNVYLSVFVSCGIVAFVGLIMIMSQMFKNGYLVWKQSAAKVDMAYWLMAGWVSGYAGMMVANAFQNSLWERFVWVPAVLVAILISRQSLQSESGFPN